LRVERPASSAERRRRFLQRIAVALGRRQRASLHYDEVPEPDTRSLLAAATGRTHKERMALLKRLSAAADPLQIRLGTVPTLKAAASAVIQVVRRSEPEWGARKEVYLWRHPLVDRLGLAAGLDTLGIPIHREEPSSKTAAKDDFCEKVASSFVGVTSADFCVADTATLVLKTRPGQSRSVSLVPSVHIAVIEISQIVADLKELYALLQWDPAHRAEGLTHCMTLITGPSKTADIEATLVHGAHGPRELHLFVITGSE